MLASLADVEIFLTPDRNASKDGGDARTSLPQLLTKLLGIVVAFISDPGVRDRTNDTEMVSFGITSLGFWLQLSRLMRPIAARQPLTLLSHVSMAQQGGVTLRFLLIVKSRLN